jgi:hypothetical protein
VAKQKERAQYMHKDATVDLRADSKLLILLRGRIAQLVRALASHARGRRFESYCDHHFDTVKNRPPPSFSETIAGPPGSR